MWVFQLTNTVSQVGAWNSTHEPLGSKRLQLNRGGGATPFLLRDLDSRDAVSIPTAPTNLSF